MIKVDYVGCGTPFFQMTSFPTLKFLCARYVRPQSENQNWFFFNETQYDSIFERCLSHRSSVTHILQQPFQECFTLKYQDEVYQKLDKSTTKFNFKLLNIPSLMPLKMSWNELCNVILVL